MRKAAPGDLQETYDLLRKINNEETPSKGLTEKLDQYQQLKQRVQSAADAFNYLNDQIKETKQQKKDAGGEVAKAMAEIRTLATEEAKITDQQSKAEPGSEKATGLAERLQNIAQRRAELKQKYIDN